MEDILQKIIEKKRQEILLHKEILTPDMLYKQVEERIQNYPSRSFSRALVNSSTGIIAEFKRKSPSLGWIKEEGKPDVIPSSYEANGASALSILTDQHFFGGDMNFIRIARPAVSIPILRKDFILDEYQIYQAKDIGADAILLIAACITKEECKMLTKKALELNMEVLLEVHNEQELDYILPEINMVGVNNRDLKTFQTHIDTSFYLGEKIPQDKVKISESGLADADIIKELQSAGFDGFLMGERFMKTSNPGEALKDFIGMLS